ncbi:protein disulfide isomerase-like 1-4 [Olea europaea var. sylvestris]|uniref:protein disulfide isomerase-like 1-4 n=1 Tax=Olea europaea var. sylvestris TaxID=158386 RepID=UPI000C1D05F8|nr:protein disulfide isomerase-like 1-4 [Olea europaea var. sylvestris]
MLVNCSVGQFTKSSIAKFVFANKLPLVTTFTRESAPLIFESPIKKQLLLFTTSKDLDKVVPAFQEAAKLFKGKLLFVHVEMDNEDVGKPVADYFGVTGDASKEMMILRNMFLMGKSLLIKLRHLERISYKTSSNHSISLIQFPRVDDGDVKTVIRNNFDEIVLDGSKDVLLEIYAPWCGHCQALEPTYKKLTKHLHGIESLVIAKMDGTTNEHPRAKADGFPSILFFPAGNKSFEPITVDADRTVVAFYKFLKKHAAIPSKLEKPTSSPASEDSNGKRGIKSSSSDVKDEL